MQLLILNCGSSSVKGALIDIHTGQRLARMHVKNLNQSKALLSFDDSEAIDCPGKDYESALNFALSKWQEQLHNHQIEGIAHRVVHGGTEFQAPVLIDTSVIEAIDQLEHLAPLHNPVNLAGIQVAQKVWSALPQVAVFDTAFHSTLPRRAQAYALNPEIGKKYGLRRYGFHGSSHSYVSRAAAAFLGFPIRDLRLISCHLGNGASVCAIEYGRSIETSMGMTPLEGLVMGTRSGDIDPGIISLLLEKEQWTAAELDAFLNRNGGLKGLSGTNNMEEIEQRATQGDDDARLAIQVFCHRLRKYIGAYAALMGGVDAIIFTGGIGENSATIRERSSQRLEFLGAVLDEDANRDADLDERTKIADISSPNSRCKLLVVPTDEQYEIARQAGCLLNAKSAVKNQQAQIPIAISARHVHLTQESVDILFGKGHQLTEYKPLSQPGQFAANERVSLLGPRNQIDRVRILGPCRSINQVEISRTDEFFLGLDAPVRASGKIKNSPGITLIGPKGSLTLKEGVICAWRHIHMTPEDAENFGVEDRDIVEVAVQQGARNLTFGNVLIRVSPKYKLEMHIDTDEANAAELSRGAQGVLIATEASGALVKRERTELQ